MMKMNRGTAEWCKSSLGAVILFKSQHRMIGVRILAQSFGQLRGPLISKRNSLDCETRAVLTVPPQSNMSSTCC